MSLISACLGFLLKKAGGALLLMLSLFLGFLLIQVFIPALREAVADLDRLDQVTRERAALEQDLEQLRGTVEEGQRQWIESLGSQLEAEIEEGRSKVAAKKGEIEDLRDEQSQICDTVQKVIDFITPGSACKTAEQAVQKADEALDTLERSLGQAQEDAAVLADPNLTPAEKLDRLGEGEDQSVLQREIDNVESELDQKRAEEKSLEKAKTTGLGWVVQQWLRSWKWLAGIAIVVVLLPFLLRFVAYYLLMPIVNRIHRPIHLAAGREFLDGELHSSEVYRTLRIELGPGEVLSARSEHVRPVQGQARSHVLYDWSSPFISYAAGLYSLIRVTGDEGITTATLSTPDDPDSYLMRIDFHDHPGLVMRPRHVVGVIGMPRLETRWRWGIQSFATWQVRYIMFSGTGSLIVQGSGDVVAENPRRESMRVEQHLVMGFDSRLRVGVNRTEVFLPYLIGRTQLVDDEFTGQHPLFWQKSTTDGTRNPITKTFDVVFSALGKVLGF